MKSIDYEARREELKERYRIPDAWQDLGLEGTPAKSCKAPWRDDRKPSFSVYDDGRRYRDFSTGDEGDVISFVMMSCGWGFKDAVEWIEERAGINHEIEMNSNPLPRLHRKSSLEEKRKELKLPELDEGSPEEIVQLAKSRGLWEYAVEIALKLDFLRFGRVCGSRSWILRDESGRIAEARRLDGKPYGAYKGLPERKAHTIAGSQKSWPLGLSAKPGTYPDETAILLVEGGPDYLAAFDFMARKRVSNMQPIAILGKTNRIDKNALTELSGKRVRMFPHTDGMCAAETWANQLNDVGCEVDAFTFDGLVRCDGRPVTDLNDLLLVSKEDRKEWEGVLPV